MEINPNIDAEYINITIPQNLTIYKLLENTIEKMKYKFSIYSAFWNN